MTADDTTDFETDYLRIYTGDDRNVAFYALQNDDAWLGMEAAPVLRDWR